MKEKANIYEQVNKEYESHKKFSFEAQAVETVQFQKKKICKIKWKILRKVL